MDNLHGFWLNTFKTLKSAALGIRNFDHPILMSGIVLFVLATVILTLSSLAFSNFDEYYYQILIEANGMLLDLAVVGMLLYWVNKTRESKLLIRTCKDEIEDFRLWESEEAAYRTVGNIKRLNRHKVHSIDLVKTYLVQTNLSYVNLKGSNLNLANLEKANLIGSQLSSTKLNQTNLVNANLNQANLDNCFATGANLQGAFLIKANLSNAFLLNSNFSDSFLIEANLRNTQVANVNFQNASLYKADLRGAIGLTFDQLAKAKTLNQAKLDHTLKAEIEGKFPELLSA